MVNIIIAIIDLSDTKVLHITYPQGYKLSKEQLDPSVGNFFDPKDSYKRNKAKARQASNMASEILLDTR